MIMSVGAWTLRVNNFIEYILRLGQVVETLKQFKKTTVGQYTRLIWFTTPPARETGHPSWLQDNRNTYAISAANLWVKSQLRNIGVDIFDVVPIAYPKTDAYVCFGHVLCLENGKETPYDLGAYFIKPYMHGLAGRAVMDYFLQALCGDVML